MAITFNADEIFEIAEQIERNGQKFYSKSSERVQNKQAKAVLKNLADMETKHLETFQRLHAKIDAKTREELTWDPDGQAVAYLRAAADSHIFKTDTDPTSLLSDNSDPKEILELALQFEKDSVVYFLGVSDMVPERLGKAEVLRLAKQEQGHIAIIQRTLSTLNELKR